MKNLNKIFGIAGITALSFLPMDGKGQNMRYISENDFTEIIMNDKEWKSYSDSGYNLRKEIYSLAKLELTYAKRANSYLLHKNKVENEKCMQNVYCLEQIRLPLEKELLNQTKKLQAREKELKEK